MTITSVAQWSTDQAQNTDVAGNDIAEGCSPAGINNAIRYLMAQIAATAIAEFGTVALLIADTAKTYSNTTAGDYIRTRAEGFAYLVAASGASDHHVTTGGGLKLYALQDGKGVLWLEQFGADMTGAASCTTKLQALLDAAAGLQCDVQCGPGTIKSGQVTILGGVGNIDFRQAEWIGLLVLGVPLTTTPRVDFSGYNTRKRNIAMRMNMDEATPAGNDGDLLAFAGVIKSTSFRGTEIYNYTDHATLNHIGIRFEAGSDDCDVEDVKWTGFTDPTQRGIGVHCTGTVAAYAGYFTGTLVRATDPVTNIRIHKSTFLNGSYAWVPNGTEFSVISECRMEGQNHRGVQFTSGCFACGVNNNVIKDFTSSAVLFSYGSTYCYAVNNAVDLQVNAGGEAAFNVNTGAVGTLVEGNHGYADCNYFVYVATGASKSIVRNNVGEGFYVAGVCLQSDWSDPTDGAQVNNIFDRSNFESASVLDPSFTGWASADLTGVIVEGNLMGNGSRSNRAAYAVVQMRGEAATSYGVTATFRNNGVHNTTNIVYDLSVYLDNGTVSLTLENNDFREGTGFYHRADTTGTGKTWNAVTAHYQNNRGIDQIIMGEALNLTVNSTTPAVTHNGPKDRARFFTCANSSPTSITDFTSQYAGQEIILRLDTNTTLVYASGTMRLKGAVNVSGRSSNDTIVLRKLGSIWLETSRSW